jgi:hypothetical protein
VTATRERAREPQSLSLAAAPSAFGIDVQHRRSHGAQLT